MNQNDLIAKELNNWQAENKTQRLWNSDPTLWTNSDEAKWTGWLNIIAPELKELPEITNLAQEIKKNGYQHVVVLGMGGSSLCPALFAATFGEIAGNPRLHVLDSTDPEQIHQLDDQIDIVKTIFIVASKSGSTLEPNIFKAYYYAKLQTALNKTDVGDRFIAITDPNTKMESIAKSEQFKAIFYGDPSIGGRYSALSNFGMVPATFMGVDSKQLLQQAEKMAQACSPKTSAQNNPGVQLGVTLGCYAKEGKDKVTLIVSPAIASLGAWLEQLLAESTGKIGKGLIPVDQEPLGAPEVYGRDRLFVYIRLESDPDKEQDQALERIEKSGQIVVRLTVANKDQLGAEFFRWEIATAVAGSIIGVNPFDQPDVEASKVRTLQLTAEYEKNGHIPAPKPFFSADGLQLFTDENNLRELEQHLLAAPSIKEYLRAHFNRVTVGDYIDFAAFIAMSETHIAWLQKSRVLLRDDKKVATCLGFGPRFLHSTGQAYKGGPNTGVFLQITADHAKDIPVPGTRYSFGLVIAAQAQADFEVLAQRGRRILRVHLGSDPNKGLQKLYEYLKEAI